MQTEKLRYSVDRNSIFVKLTVILLGLSVLFRLIGCWGFWNTQDKGYIWLQVILPVIACGLYIALILRFGSSFSLTAAPVVLGAVFFIAHAFTLSGWLLIAVSVVLVLLVTVGYCAVVFGAVVNKLFLLPLFGLPFLYKLMINDRATLLAKPGAMPLEYWLPELSALCILLALCLITFAMKKKELPRLETVEGVPSEISEILELDSGENTDDDRKET